LSLRPQVADVAEDVAIRDIFGKLRLSERAYGSAQIDVPTWAPDIEADFRQWRHSREPRA